jgi:hypothetical protein
MQNFISLEHTQTYCGFISTLYQLNPLQNSVLEHLDGNIIPQLVAFSSIFVFNFPWKINKIGI